MSREVHVPFCEELGVRFPWLTPRAPGMARSGVTGARCHNSEWGSDPNPPGLAGTSNLQGANIEVRQCVLVQG